MIIPVVAACITETRAQFVPRLFLLHKKTEARNPELLGKWEFAGGMMEHGETPEVALMREVQEELDLKVDVGRLLWAKSFLPVSGEHYLVLYYHCVTYKYLPPLVDSKWFTQKEIFLLPRDSALEEVKEVVRLFK